MRAIADQLVAEYLKRLERALRALPRDRRRELLDEIREHIAAGRAELPDESEASIRTLLDRIGEPGEIAAEARERFGIGDARAGVREALAPPLLLLGGVFVPLLGWCVGVALLWTSPIWTRRDKWIGTLLVPGGLSLAVYTMFLMIDVTPGCSTLTVDGRVVSDTCSDGPSVEELLVVAGWATLVVIPFLTAIYLGWRLRGRFAHAPAT